VTRVTPAATLAKSLKACAKLKTARQRTACATAARKRYRQAINAQKLAAALTACAKLKSAAKRQACERAARRRY
jgi:hypothetical protein